MSDTAMSRTGLPDNPENTGAERAIIEMLKNYLQGLPDKEQLLTFYSVDAANSFPEGTTKRYIGTAALELGFYLHRTTSYFKLQAHL